MYRTTDGYARNFFILPPYAATGTELMSVQLHLLERPSLRTLYRLNKFDGKKD